MIYEYLIKNISKLCGLKLPSIRPGAEIEIIQVTRDNIVLKTAKGKQGSRSLSEIKRIWEQLCVAPAVHVDTALRGAGSSRNQPETILANLPYIEWLRIDRAKHISFVGKNTHPYGTIKQMDAFEAEQVKERLEKFKSDDIGVSQVIVVADDTGAAASRLQEITGLSMLPLEPGLYQRISSHTVLLLVASSLVPTSVEPGSYSILLMGREPPDSVPLVLAGKKFYAVCDGPVKFMAVVY